MSHRVFPSAVILLLLASSLATAAPDPAAADQAAQTALDLRVANGLITAYLEDRPDLEFPTEWVSLKAFTREWPELYRTRLPFKDGWGARFRIGTIGDGLMIVSPGANGAFDLESAPEGDLTLGSRRLFLGEEPIDDLAIQVDRWGEVLNGPLNTRQRQGVTMADVRSVAVAVETYSIDNNRYPSQPQGLGVVDGIAAALAPVYIRALPLVDGWGNPLLYWSDANEYVVVSTGADGVLDRNDLIDRGADHPPGSFTNPDRDIVFRNGQFERWPEGIQQ